MVVVDVLAGQAEYYRRRAGEYDDTSYGDLAVAGPRIERIVAEMRPRGSVLEIACGTGLWTAALADWADSVTAIDAAPETIAIAHRRVTSERVSFEVADAFAWQTERRFDVIFFAAWLSHVPASHFDMFWQRLRTLLADGGRVLFLDEHVDARGKESYLPGEDEIVERQLRDGSTFRVVKNFVDPAQLERRLATIGWRGRVRRDGDDWVVGEARPGT